MHFVSVEKHDGKPCVKVKVGDNACQRYPLTKKGCLQAGRDLYAEGIENWINSSSVDFPQAVKPGCKLDVRELMGQGFQEAADAADAPRKRMVAKVLAFCLKSDEFMSSLDPDEFTAFSIAEEANRQ